MHTLGAALLLLALSCPFSDAKAATVISAGFNQAAAIKSNGTLFTWGNNSTGQLGNGTTTNSTTPVQIGSATNWSAVSAGNGSTFALRSGTLWSWGSNTAGQLGNGTTTNTDSPVQVGSAANWVAVSAGGSFAVALQSNGTLWAWGNNTSGQLGNGTTTNTDSPVQVGSAANWVAVAAGSDFTVALQSNGTLWAWGDNTTGQLGNGTITTTDSPVQVGSATNWVAVAAGFNHTAAIASNGTLWTWGNNSTGQLGNGTTTNSTTPVQIGSATNWAAVAAGNGFTVALQSNGTLWTWGNNSTGQLGNGTTTNSASPLRIASGFQTSFQVASTNPASNATNVPVTTSIQATFNTPVDPASVTPTTFIVSRGVTGTLSIGPSPTTVTFTPSRNLGFGTTYTVTITTGLISAIGGSLVASHQWSFTTEANVSGGEGGGRGGSNCFIATAAYGSGLDWHVAVLRAFRDRYLVTSRTGRYVVRVYYRHSPFLAGVIAKRPALKQATRWALAPVVYAIVHPWRSAFLPLLALAFACFRKIGRAVRGRRERHKNFTICRLWRNRIFRNPCKIW